MKKTFFLVNSQKSWVSSLATIGEHSHHWWLKHRYLEQEKRSWKLSIWVMWFLLKNLITDITCFKATNVTLINVLLGNKWRCFHHTAYLWNRLTWLSQTNTYILQRLLRNFLRNNIEYRNYKNYNENNFLHELDQELSKESTYEQKHHQYVFTNIF